MPIDSASTQEAGLKTTAPRSSRAVTLPVACGLGMAAIALSFTAINSETVVATGFERAFAALQLPALKVADRAYDGIAGTEEFWLRANTNANLIKAVAVGQEITLASNGTERRLTITKVAEADDAITHIQTSANRALLVTCREGNASTGREIRFRLDANQIVELPAASSSAQRTL